MEVIAEDADGNSYHKKEDRLHSAWVMLRNPDWNQWLDFGNHAWKKYRVRVFDEDDGNADDPLSSLYTS